MTEIETKINNILAEWNPLCVDFIVSKNEYKEYVPIIMTAAKNWEELKSTINNIVETMGIDSTLACMKADTYNVATAIYNISKETPLVVEEDAYEFPIRHKLREK